MRGLLTILLGLVIPIPSSVRAGEEIFASGAKLKVEAEGVGGEGPAWDPKLGVLMSGKGQINQFDRDGKSRVFREKAGTNGLLFDAQGRLLACEPDLRRVTRMDRDGKVTVLTEKYEGKRFNQPNDLTVDSQGRIYFSDPCYGPRDKLEIRDDKGRTVEGVYRIDPDGKVTRVIGREVERANGVLVSADNRYLFVADNNNNTRNGARKLWRFDLRKDGTVDAESRKLLYDWGQGRGPDGVKQDQKGRLYVAGGLNKPNPPFEPDKDKKGGIYVLSPEGKLLAFLPVPRDEVTNCAFGGDDLKTLYVTAGGTLCSIRTTTPGRVVWPRAKGGPANARCVCGFARQMPTAILFARLQGNSFCLVSPGVSRPSCRALFLTAGAFVGSHSVLLPLRYPLACCCQQDRSRPGCLVFVGQACRFLDQGTLLGRQRHAQMIRFAVFRVLRGSGHAGSLRPATVRGLLPTCTGRTHAHHLCQRCLARPRAEQQRHLPGSANCHPTICSGPICRPLIRRSCSRLPGYGPTRRVALTSAIRSISSAVGQPSFTRSSRYLNQAVGRSYRSSFSSLPTTSNLIASLSGASRTD